MPRDPPIANQSINQPPRYVTLTTSKSTTCSHLDGEHGQGVDGGVVGEGGGEGQPQYVLASELEEGGGLPLHPHQALVAHVAGGSHRAHPDLTVAHPEQDAHLSFSLQILRNAFLHYLRDNTVILPLPSQLILIPFSSFHLKIKKSCSSHEYLTVPTSYGTVYYIGTARMITFLNTCEPYKCGDRT